MTDIMTFYDSALQVFLSGMNTDIINLVVIGISLATTLFFLSLPILIVKGW